MLARNKKNVEGWATRQSHWPTDEDIDVDYVRDGSIGNTAARSGDPRWRRVTELRAREAK
jgi:hypothetical protein